MKKRILGPTLLAALMCTVLTVPSRAQMDAGDVLNFTGNMFRLGVEIDRANRQQQQINAAAAAERQAIEDANEAKARRVQTALKTLGFYSITVDGDWGPGTDRAIAEYQAAFQLSGAMDDFAIQQLEHHAAQGWRSDQERAAAAAGGFADRDSFVAAQAGGFSSARDYQGAQAAGFSDAESFAAFQKSGATDRTAYEQQLNQTRIAAELADQCLAGGDWQARLSACRLAAGASPNDAALALAMDQALADARQGLSDIETQLDEKTAELTALLAASNGGSTVAVNTIRVEINTLTEINLLASLEIQARDCNDLLVAEDWGAAIPACYVDTDVSALIGPGRAQAEKLVAEIRAGRSAAETGRADERQKLAEEAERLAVAEARSEATALLGLVDAYSASGKTFEQGVAILRAMVALRGSLERSDAARITADHAALADLVEADAGFVSAREAMAEAESQAAQTALITGRRQAEVMNAFITAYIIANVTSDNAASLLPVSEALEAALNSDNGELILSTQASAREALTALELSQDFASFAAAYAAPQVSAEALEQAEQDAEAQVANAANAEQALALARAQASAMLADIDAFSKAGGSTSDPMAVARAVARVKDALAGTELGELTTATAALNDLMSADSRFVAAMTERAANQDNALANAIALAKEDLATLDAFLRAHIAANLTADNIVQLVDLQLAVESAAGGAGSAATVQVRDEALAALGALGLDGKVRDFAETQRSSAVGATTETAQNGLSVTPANAALLEGDDGDLLVLRRSDGQAPHLTYNLLGQLHVDGGTATACWAHAAQANPLALLMARRELRGMGVPNLALAQCDDATPVDLVLLRRGDFIAAPPSTALPVVAAFEEGQLDLLLTIAGKAAEAEMAEMAATSQALAMAIDNGTANGFGLLALSAGAGDICPVVERIDAHRNPLVRRVDEVSFAIAAPRLGSAVATEAAFAAAQRGQCTGIYADAATLRTFSDAFKRIGVEFVLTPVWVESSEVEAEMAQLAALEAAQIAQAALEKQQAEAAEAVLAAQTADQRSDLEKRQAASRAEYQDRADAGHKTIADMVRAMVGAGSSSTLQQWFPAAHGDLAQLLHDRWALTDLETTLADYGTATWQDRQVEAVLVRADIQRENALAGVYGEDCLVLGWLVDVEFRVNRDPFEAACSDTEALQAWSAGRSFNSVWNLTAN
jgi:peptidoglycan hydrolase-like protein with peptidoglycan-binding domain